MYLIPDWFESERVRETMKEVNSKQNMLTGKPGRTLFFFAIPMILGNLFQQFYNTKTYETFS